MVGRYLPSGPLRDKCERIYSIKVGYCVKKGYYIIWAFYTSLHVETKKESYVFDFDSALVAVGGSLGLFLGWSCQSIVSSWIDYISDKLMKGTNLL